MRFKLFTSKMLLRHVLLSCYIILASACSSVPDEVESAKTEQQQVTQEVPEKELNIVKNETLVEQASELDLDTSGINKYAEQQENNKRVIPASIVSKYQKALTLMNKKDWPQAQSLLDEVALAQPQLSGTYVNKAIIFREQGDFAQAQILLSKAISVNELNLYAHHIKGQIYRLQGDFIAAEKSYQAALAIWPKYAPAHLDMAILLELYRGRLIDAYHFYYSYIQLNKNDDEALRWLAGLEIKIKRAGLELPKVTNQREEPESNPTEIEAKES